MRIRLVHLFWTLHALTGPGVLVAQSQPAAEVESFAERRANVQTKLARDYPGHRFNLSSNYFSRYSRDPDAGPGADETEIGPDWQIAIAAEASTVARRMAGDLAEFLDSRMSVKPAMSEVANTEKPAPRSIVLIEAGGGDAEVTDSFTIEVQPDLVLVRGQSAGGLRDGVVKLVDLIGFRHAPILRRGKEVYRPRLTVRLGSRPLMGACREVVFGGYNAITVYSASLQTISTSDAIPELTELRAPNALAYYQKLAQDAGEYGMKKFATLSSGRKFPKDHPLFAKYPDIRGALTWQENGEHALCTEHPLVRRYYMESVEGYFRNDPELCGSTIIIGGESFYHCFMRAYGAAQGHTTCPRCEALGPDVVVSNLCNYLAEAARRVNPKAEIIAWPYSAYIWSADKVQSGFINLLKPGTAIFTELEKDEVLQKPDGISKSLWDYSLDMTGPGERATKQIELCKAVGIPLYIKSEPESTLDYPRLPHIPAMDRWIDRAEALATCGASGAFVTSGFRTVFGTSATETNKFMWWEPTPAKEDILQQFAARIAGPKAGPHLRAAWKYAADAIPLAPTIPSYYTGPYYLGPAHPMFADLKAAVPKIFEGYYLFLAELTDAEGTKLRPTYVQSPPEPKFGKFYLQMREVLQKAVNELDKAEADVPAHCRLMFDAESSSIRYFYHTVRTEANFYESCRLRDAVMAIVADPNKTPEQLKQAEEMHEQWQKVLEDEKINATTALPLAEADIRLDSYFGGDHSFSHTTDMIRAKLELLEKELTEFLPTIAKRISPP